MSKTSFIHKIIWISNYFVYPKGFKLWLAMFYNVFHVIAIYRISTDAADTFLQFLGVVAFSFLFLILLLIKYTSYD